nr:MAG TPA: hypothetical protein [Caudoviricetes sp.]
MTETERWIVPINSTIKQAIVAHPLAWTRLSKLSKSRSPSQIRNQQHFATFFLSP